MAHPEQERLEALFKAADDFRRAEDIRSFVAKLSHRIDEPRSRRDDALEQWDAWALREADRIDPALTQALPSLMEAGKEASKGDR